MLINIGRFFMALVWCFALFNLVKPFPVPGNYFLYVGLACMVFMHGIKVLMLRSMILPGEAKLTTAEQWRIFFFGVFELLAWQKKQKQAALNNK